MKVTIRLSQDDEFDEIVDLQTRSLIASYSQSYTQRQLHSLIKGQKVQGEGVKLRLSLSRRMRAYLHLHAS